MDKENTKKLLYKENPKAKLLYIRKGAAWYQAVIGSDGVGELVVTFDIPVSDMGDADFLPEMDAKYLMRYIVD